MMFVLFVSSTSSVHIEKLQPPNFISSMDEDFPVSVLVNFDDTDDQSQMFTIRYNIKWINESFKTDGNPSALQYVDFDPPSIVDISNSNAAADYYIPMQEKRGMYQVTFALFDDDDHMLDSIQGTTCYPKIPVVNLTMNRTFITPNTPFEFYAEVYQPNFPTMTDIYCKIRRPNDIQTLSRRDPTFRRDEREIYNKTIKYYYPQPSYSMPRYRGPRLEPNGLGNFTLDFYCVPLKDYDSIGNNSLDFSVREMPDITFLGPKKFFASEEIVNLTFNFTTPTDDDIYYNIYVNDEKTSVFQPSSPFNLTLRIPADIPVGQFRISYKVTIADQINSTNKNDNLVIVSRPFLSEAKTESTKYTIDQTVNIIVKCTDNDEHDRFSIYAKYPNDNNFRLLGVQDRTETQNILNIQANNSLLLNGINTVSIKVIDSYGKESNTVDVNVTIIQKPIVKITPITNENRNFSLPGETVQLQIEIHDQDEGEIIKGTYSIDHKVPTNMEDIHMPSTHVYSNTFHVEIPHDFNKNSIDLGFVFTDQFSLKTKLSLSLPVHYIPELSPKVNDNKPVVAGRTYSVTFEIIDNDLPDDEINISYKFAQDDEYKFGITYKDGSETNFNITIPSNLENTTINMSFKAMDKYGLSKEVTKSVQIKGRPSVTIDQSLDGQNYVAGSVLMLTGTVKDPDNDKCTVVLKTNSQVNNTDFLNSGENYKLEYTIPDNQEVGSIQFTLNSKDIDGLESNPMTFTINVRSKPKFIEPCTYNKEVYKSGDSVTIECNIKDDDEDENIKSGTVDGDLFTVEKTTPMSSNPLKITFGPYTIPNGFTAPSFDKKLRVQDKYGFYSDLDAKINLKNKPNIFINEVNQQYFIHNDTVIINGTITDEDPIDSVTIRINWMNINKEITVNTAKGQPSPFSFNFTIPADAPLGNMNVTITATDSSNIPADNAIVSKPIYFKPLVRITPNLSIYKPGQTAQIQIEIEDHDANDAVILKYRTDSKANFAEIKRYESFGENNKVISQPIEIQLPDHFSGFLPIEFVGEDSHTISSYIETTQIQIRNPPTITGALVKDKTIIKGENITIQGHINDLDSTDEFTININGEPIRFMVDQREFSINFKHGLQILGSNTISLTVTDSYGLTSSEIPLEYSARARPVIKFVDNHQGRHLRNTKIPIIYNISDEDENDKSTLQLQIGNTSFSPEEPVQTTPNVATKKYELLIPNNISYGINKISISAQDSYGFSASDESSIYILSPVAFNIIPEEHPRTVKQGQKVPVKISIHEIDGEKNVTVKLLDENGTVLAEKNFTCDLKNGHSTCENIEDTFEIEIPRNASNGDFKIHGTAVDNYDQKTEHDHNVKVFNYPPELKVNNTAPIAAISNTTIPINYLLRDKNIDDHSEIFIEFKCSGNATKIQPMKFKYNTTTDWTNYSFNLPISSNFSIGDSINISIYAVDENGAKSEITKLTVKIEDPRINSALLGDKDKGFNTINEYRAFILILIGVFIIITLIIILILMLYPKRKKEMTEEEEDNKEIEEVELPSNSNSGETFSVSSNDMELSEGGPTVAATELPSNSDSGETVVVDSDDVSEEISDVINI